MRKQGLHTVLDLSVCQSITEKKILFDMTF